MTKRQKKNLIRCTLLEERIIIGLTVTLFILAGAYLSLLTKSVINISTQKHIKSQIVETRSSLSMLEASYINKKNQIDMKLVRKEGFTKPAEKTYLQAKSITKKTNTLNNGI